MYEVSSPPAINKRRSWTGRLRDRLKSTTSRAAAEDQRHHQVVNRADDEEWMDPWASPKLLEGHRAKTHAQPVPTLQGSVFVAANFVYDYRQKYVADPNSGGGGGAWMAGPPGAPHLPPPAPPAVIYQQCGADQTVDWSAGRGMRPRSRSRARTSDYETVGRTVFRSDSGRSNAELPYDRADLERLHSGMTQPVSRTQFRATDVNQNLGHVTKVQANERPKCSPLSDYATVNCNNNNNSRDEVTVNDPEGSAHPQTTVAVDRPGLLVSGQRICIFTGQDEHSVKRIESEHPEQGHVTKVILRVTGDTTPRAASTCSSQATTFQRNCPLRRSLSDRVAPKMATVANFNDTTRLHQRTRSRGSLHELFQSAAASTEGLDADASAQTVELESAKPPLGHPALSSRFLSPTRPTEPPPPPPTCGGRADESQEVEAAPVAPPRRIFRYSKAELDAFGRRLSATKSKSSADQESADGAAQVVALSPGITLGSSWVGRPLSGQMISWSAWAGLGQQPTAHAANGPAADGDNPSTFPRADKVGSRVLISTPQLPDAVQSAKVLLRTDSGKRSNNSSDETASAGAPSSPGDGKRRPVSRLWPSFTAIRRDRSLQTSGHVKAPASGHTSDAAPHGGTQPVADETEPETDHRYTDEHIYEEIDEKREPPDGDSDGVDHRSLEPVGLSRVGRGSFAGASRQDILRYLEELRKKSAESSALAGCGHGSSNETPRTLSPVSPQASVTPSLPQLLPSDDYMAEDEDMATMGALLLAMRHNAPNRHSNRSNASSSQSSEESALSASVPLAGSYQRTKVGGDIERNDSGVGSETSGTARLRRRLRNNGTKVVGGDAAGVAASDGCLLDDPDYQPWCVDCDQPLINQESSNANDEESLVNDPLVCSRCARRRSERREVLAELLETEVRYGRDLRVLQDELYKPLLVAGLVPLRQLDAVFLNVSELSGQSQRFSQRLREAVEIALEQGDEDLLTVDVGKIFLDKETEEMMDAFRRYCVRSGEASLLLSSLEKERELLRIFLRASQLENPALRRMDLHAFLMVPVQRITKYPLLLGRLLRATAQQDVETRETLREAQAKVESYLTAINSEAKELGSFARPWRRGHSVPNLNLNFNLNSIQRPSGEDLMTLRLRKVALDALGWTDHSQFILEGFMKLTQPSDLLLTATRSRGRALKWQNIWAALIVLNQQDKPSTPTSTSAPVGSGGDIDLSRMVFAAKSSVQEAAVVFVKDIKNPRPGPSLYRDPLLLSQCTISYELELPNFFEVHHIVSKESYICQMLDGSLTQQWLHQLRTLSVGLGRWKQRRNALPHVMMIN